jgi:hypothetical protein
VFTIAKEEGRKRLMKRKTATRKDIPDYIIKNMTKSFELPTKKEGFDKILIDHH